MNRDRDIIVVTSDEPWSEVWHTQLHYAWQLSQRFNVIYVAPPAPWSVSNLFRLKGCFRHVNPSLTVYSYHNLLPAFLGLIAMYVNDILNQFAISKFISPMSRKKVTMVWQFDHYRGYYLFRSGGKTKHLYHLVDPYAKEKYDGMFAKGADLVVVTSPKFINHYLSLNKQSVLIPQGVDLKFYEKQVVATATGVQDYTRFSDSILLLGTLSDDVDYALLYKIAQQYPGKLLIIGPDKIVTGKSRMAWKKLIDSKLVTWLGPMEPAAFLPYLRSCRVGIITYVEESLISNNLRSPLKVINYIAAGKCVISNIDCELPELTDKAVYYAGKENRYYELISMAYNGELLFDTGLVKSYLDSVSYDKHLIRIFEKLALELPEPL